MQAIVVAVAANQVIFPSANALLLSVLMNAPQKNIVVDGAKVKGCSGLPCDFSVLDYLNVANGLVCENYCSDAVCRDYGRAIFDAYQGLVRVNGRSDLSDKVRVCADLKRQNGHLWIEYLDAGVVVPFQLYDDGVLSRVGVRTLWGKKLSYPTRYSLFRRGV